MPVNKNEGIWKFAERLLASEEMRVGFLWGPPGVGKTYAAYFLGRTDNGVYPITLTQETPAAELRGHFVPQGDRFVWQDGAFTLALRRGGRLVINEISHASPDVLALLYPVLESIETAQLQLPNDEVVRPAPGFHVVVTDNESPDSLPEALQDRFDVRLEIDTPHPDALARLHPELRRAAERAFSLDKERSISLRKWLAVQRFTENGDLDLKDACRAVFGEERGTQVHEAIVLAAENPNLFARAEKELEDAE